MAAVVKPKGKNRKPPTILEKPEESEADNGSSELTTPLLSNKREKVDNIVVDIEKDSPAGKTFNEAIADGLNPSLDDCEDDEIIGIITLEDVFEELLQVIKFCC